MGHPKPLSGIRIIDLSQAAAGPLCSANLAALGAEVIKVERPGMGDMARKTPPYAGADGVGPVRRHPDDVATTVLKRNRDKKGLALNLQAPEGLAILKRLVAVADVVLENFRPGVTEKLGIDYQSLRPIKPDLIYCSVTGFGRSGPYKDWLAFDTIMQAMGGVMASTGSPGGVPTKTGVIVGDLFAPLYAMSAILAALRYRDQTGEGQFIEVSMFDCLIAVVWDEPIEYFLEHKIPSRTGNRLSRMAPWNVYPTKDGYVVICAGQQAHWTRLAELMGSPALAADPRFVTVEQRLANVEALDAEVERWTRSRTRQEIVVACQSGMVPCGPVNELQDLVNDPHLRARGLLGPLLHPTQGEIKTASVPAFPVRFSTMPAGFEGPAPLVGQHTREILSSLLGMSEAEIAALAEKEVV